MINRGATLLGRMASLFMLVAFLTACGGGGGGGGGFLPGSGNQEDDLELSLALSLLTPDGQPTNSVTAAQPATLLVHVTEGIANSGDDAQPGRNVANVVVKATTDLATIDPPSGSALTDENGVATFRLIAGDLRGAGLVTVSAELNGNSEEKTLGFQVGDSGLRLGYFDTDGSFVEGQIFVEPTSTLAAGGNAQLSVVAVDANGNRVTTAESVIFGSGCISGQQATINPPDGSVTINGKASTLYTAAGCAGLDQITASTPGANSQATATINVAAPTTNAIRFDSAEPSLIVLRGTGGVGRDETSEVSFTIVDGSGSPLQGVTVNFDLTTDVGGVELSTPSALSNGEGQVKVTVQAGDVATVARVIATVTNENGEVVSTLSDQLTITTGLPDQNSISLAVGGCSGEETFVVDGAFNIDGLCRELTVSMADKFNNPVVDGTAAVFTTEYGSIVGNCETENGVCSVEWRSQEPRLPTLSDDDFVKRIDDSDYNCPSHNADEGPCPDDLGYIRGGRSTILVHAIGEESFIDRNGNGIFDQDEAGLFQNLPEAFLDNNEDGVYTPGLPACISSPMGSAQCRAGVEEIFIDFDADETYDNNDDPAVYNGLLCPPEGDGVWCSRELIHVRDDAVITLGDAPNFSFLLVNGRNPATKTREDNVYTGYIADTFNNPPPTGSEISLKAEGNCEIVGPTDFEVLNTASRIGAYAFRVQTDRDLTNVEPGSFTVTLKTPVVEIIWSPISCGNETCDSGFSPKPAECP